jgi:hypothetical protein
MWQMIGVLAELEPIFQHLGDHQAEHAALQAVSEKADYTLPAAWT